MRRAVTIGCDATVMIIGSLRGLRFPRAPERCAGTTIEALSDLDALFLVIHFTVMCFAAGLGHRLCFYHIISLAVVIPIGH